MENTTINSRPNSIYIALVIIAGLLFAFYWFVIRPGQIKKECYDYAYTTPNLGDTQEWTTATNYYYEACLRRKGL